MIQFCIAYFGVLSRHTIIATSTTGRLVQEATGLQIDSCLSGTQGGGQQIASRIACNEVDMVIFFRDPLTLTTDPDRSNLIRLCDVHCIPIATNIATAEILVHGLERGDLDWRNLVNSKNLSSGLA